MSKFEVSVEYTNPVVVEADYYDMTEDRVIHFYRNGANMFDRHKVASFHTWLYITEKS